ncbi:TPA: hypothetical protein ACS8BP_001275 [Providencia alcalifaciens]
MHLQEIVRAAPVVGLYSDNDPFLILQIVAKNCVLVRKNGLLRLNLLAA